MNPSVYKCPHLADLPLSSPGKTGWPWTEESSQLPGAMPDGSPWPKISVVTPSFNQGQFLEETIRSVLLQGYPNIEFIIFDGGSTDNSLEVIKKYEQWLAYWVSEPDRGQSHAINKGIREASGDILFWLNSDDLCLPDVFQLVAGKFHANPAVSLVIGQARLINVGGDVIGELHSSFSTWEELVTNPQNSVRQISSFFARRLFDEMGLVDESLHIAMDTELLVRFTQFHTPLILDGYLAAYRMQPDAKTYSHLLMGYEESDRTRVRYFYNKQLAGIYHRRSADNWLSLSESDRLTASERVTCIWKGIQNRPSLIFLRDFWSSLKKLGLNLLGVTVPA